MMRNSGDTEAVPYRYFSLIKKFQNVCKEICREILQFCHAGGYGGFGNGFGYRRDYSGVEGVGDYIGGREVGGGGKVGQGAGGGDFHGLVYVRGADV